MSRKLLVLALGSALAGSGGIAYADGAKTYAAKCANCHGKDGKGETAMGKQKGVKDFAGMKLSADDIGKVVTDGKATAAGKPGSPAFKDKLPPDEIKAVAEYVKTTFVK